MWGHPICDACFSAWHLEAPDCGEAERLSTVEQLAASRAAGGLTSAFFQAWTLAWIKRTPSAVAVAA